MVFFTYAENAVLLVWKVRNLFAKLIVVSNYNLISWFYVPALRIMTFQVELR